MKVPVTPDEYRKIIEARLSGHTEPKNCYICGFDKRFTKLFVEPSVDTLVSLFKALGSSKTLEIARTFWLCDYHHKLMTNYIANDYNDDAFDTAIENCKDRYELKGYIAMLSGIDHRSRKIAFLCEIAETKFAVIGFTKKIASVFRK